MPQTKSPQKKRGRKPFVMPNDPVTKYALDVADGRIVAGRLVRLACKRHLKDLRRQGTKGFPYIFNYLKAERVFRFFGFLHFTDGDASIKGKPIVLVPFQKFILGSIFGWVHKETGYRRFKKAYLQLARKNGKSIFAAGVGLYMLLADGWWGSQVYATATKKDQAKIVWGHAVKQYKYSPDLKKRLKLMKSTSELLYEARDGVFKPLSKDTDSLDGFDPHCGVVDEYHQHPTDQMISLLEDGTVQQTQPLIFIITTAGLNLNSPCYKEYQYCCKVLEGTLQNEEYFAYIAQLDKSDKRFDETCWVKANPLVATTRTGMDGLRRLAREAQDKGGEKLRDFRTKSLNDWVDFKHHGYLRMSKWEACGVDTLPDLAGRECWVGLDLSAKIDLTSVTFEFPLDDGSFVVLSHSFMPEETLEERRKTDKVPYDQWVADGWITVTPGAAVDYRFVKQYVVDTAKANGWRIREWDFDPWSAELLSAEVRDDGYEAIEITQGMKTLSEPTKNFRELVYNGRIVHDRNPVLTWAMGNAETRQDHNLNIMLDKKKATERIDPAAATINAHARAARAMAHKEKDPYEDGIIVV